MESNRNLTDFKELSVGSILMTAIITILILFGTHSTVFSLIAFVICAYIVVIKEEYALMLLIYIMSFAHIFKISPSGMSYFTFLMLIYVMINMIKTGIVSKWGIIFTIYMFSVQAIVGVIDIKTDLKLMGNLFFILYAIEESRFFRDQNIFMSYIWGVIIAAPMRFLNSSFFHISSYAWLKTENFGYDAAIRHIERFSGIYSDPNYFGVNLILALSLIIILYKKKIIKLLHVVILSLPILYYAVLTNSKSVLFMMMLPIGMFVYCNHKKKQYATQIFFLIFVFLFVIAILSGEVHILDGVMQRINESNNLASLTTGRLDAWMEYFQFFIKYPKKLIFGVGIGNVGRESVVHSFYLESLRYAGVIGSGMIFLIIREAYLQYGSVVRKNIMNYSAIGCVLIMYAFLNQLQDYEFPLHFLLGILVLNIDLNVIE